MSKSAYFAAQDAVCENVSGPASARVFSRCSVRNTVLGAYASIGDDSRVEDSVLAEHVQLQRNNLVYHTNLGRFTYTGRNTTIWHTEIGAFCSLSWNVSVGGANHDFTRLTTHAFLYDRKDFGLMPDNAVGYNRFTEPCIIGNDVWVAANACICRGVTVGTGAVIAAGAVVTGDVAPYTIVAGVPARPLKKRFPDDIIARLLATEWWTLPAETIRENYEIFNSQPDSESLRRLEAVCRSFRGDAS